MKMTVHAQERFVGWFVLGAVAVTLSLVTLKLQKTLESSQTYHVTLQEQTYGLKRGDTVTMRGFVVGQIVEIALDTDNQLNLTFEVTGEEHYARIKLNAHVEIHSALGPLRAASLEIHPGNQDGKELPAGSRIQEVTLPKASLEAVLENVAKIADVTRIMAQNVQEKGVPSLFGPGVEAAIEQQMRTASEATELFLAPLQRSNVGLFSRGVIPRLDSDELDLPCAETRVIGTLGGVFLNSDTGEEVGLGTRRVLAQDITFSCGDVIIFEYLEDAGGFTTRVTIE